MSKVANLSSKFQELLTQRESRLSGWRSNAGKEIACHSIFANQALNTLKDYNFVTDHTLYSTSPDGMLAPSVPGQSLYRLNLFQMLGAYESDM